MYLADKYSIETYSFVFDFTEKVDDKKLMEEALAEIDKSDMLLAEASDKSVGVGLEAGYAKAKGKKIVYLYKKGTEKQQTISGISDLLIEYESAEDIIKELDTVLT